MAGNQTKSESTLIKKVGDIANVMAAAGVGFTDYITQLTYILFLKMDEEKEEMGLSSSIPDGYKWKDLVDLNGTDLIDKYEEILKELAKEDGYEGIDYLMKYDTEENLYSWFLCYDDLSWVRFEKDEE